jgi:hypothetical protein
MMQIVATFPALFDGAAAGSCTRAMQWHDNSWIVSEPLVAFGITSLNDPALVRGQMYG